MLEFDNEHVSADLSQINKKSSNNKRIGKKILLVGILITSLLLLSGCNYDLFDTKYTFNKAIIFGDDCATIVEIKKWTDYDGEQLQIETNDGTFILTSSFDTKLIDDRKSDIKAEDIVKAIKGEDVKINYLDDVAVKKRIRQ